MTSAGYNAAAKSANPRWGTERAVFASSLPTPARIIMLYLLSLADKSTGQIHPNFARVKTRQTDIMRATGIRSHHTVEKRLELLRDQGWLKYDDYRRGSRQTVLYEIQHREPAQAEDHLGDSAPAPIAGAEEREAASVEAFTVADIASVESPTLAASATPHRQPVPVYTDQTDLSSRAQTVSPQTTSPARDEFSLADPFADEKNLVAGDFPVEIPYGPASMASAATITSAGATAELPVILVGEFNAQIGQAEAAAQCQGVDSLLARCTSSGKPYAFRLANSYVEDRQVLCGSCRAAKEKQGAKIIPAQAVPAEAERSTIVASQPEPRSLRCLCGAPGAYMGMFNAVCENCAGEEDGDLRPLTVAEAADQRRCTRCPAEVEPSAAGRLCRVCYEAALSALAPIAALSPAEPVSVPNDVFGDVAGQMIGGDHDGATGRPAASGDHLNF